MFFAQCRARVSCDRQPAGPMGGGPPLWWAGLAGGPQPRERPPQSRAQSRGKVRVDRNSKVCRSVFVEVISRTLRSSAAASGV